MPRCLCKAPPEKMIYDRPYMREAQRPGHNLIKILIVANITVFVLQLLLQDTFPTILLTLNSSEFIFKPWTLVTYSFLHSPDRLLHIAFNMLMLYFIGKSLEQILNPRQLGTLFLGCILAGGIVWLAVNWGQARPQLMGASAGVTGFLIYFCLHRPNEPVTFLLFFVIPVTLKPKWIAWGVFAYEMYNFLSNEIPGTTGTAHSAHLGGMLAAVLFYRFGMGLELRMPEFLRQRRIVQQPSHKKTVQPTHYTVNHGDNDALQREVDRILDKINAKGFGSLSPKEKQTLDQAKDILRR
jgi:membrane associated rhomboid family serine protease